MFNYQMPGITSNKVVRAIQKDWTLGGSMRYQNGGLIGVPGATNNLTASLPRASGTRVNRVPGVPLFTQDPNCHCFDPAQTFILNPAAWTQPAAGQWGFLRAVLQRLSMAAAAIRESEPGTHLPHSGEGDFQLPR